MYSNRKVSTANNNETHYSAIFSAEPLSSKFATIKTVSFERQHSILFEFLVPGGGLTLFAALSGQYCSENYNVIALWSSYRLVLENVNDSV